MAKAKKKPAKKPAKAVKKSAKPAAKKKSAPKKSAPKKSAAKPAPKKAAPKKAAPKKAAPAAKATQPHDTAGEAHFAHAVGYQTGSVSAPTDDKAQVDTAWGNEHTHNDPDPHQDAVHSGDDHDDE